MSEFSSMLNQIYQKYDDVETRTSNAISSENTTSVYRKEEKTKLEDVVSANYSEVFEFKLDTTQAIIMILIFVFFVYFYKKCHSYYRLVRKKHLFLV
jgi:hypothetical protein